VCRCKTGCPQGAHISNAIKKGRGRWGVRKLPEEGRPLNGRICTSGWRKRCKSCWAKSGGHEGAKPEDITATKTGLGTKDTCFYDRSGNGLQDSASDAEQDHKVSFLGGF